MSSRRAMFLFALAGLLLVLSGACATRTPQDDPTAENLTFLGDRDAYHELPGDKDIKNSEVAYNLGVEFAEKSNMDAAHHYLNMALRMRSLAKYSYTKGLLWLSDEQWDHALTWFQKALDQGPDTVINRAEVLNCIGVCHKEMGNTEEALGFFRRVVNTPGQFPRWKTYYNMALLYYDEARYDDAELALRQVVEENPGYYRAYYKLGQIYRQREEYESAANNFKRALDLIEGDFQARKVDGPELHYLYSEMLYFLKMYQRAHDELLKVLQLSPEGPFGIKAKELLKIMGNGQ